VDPRAPIDDRNELTSVVHRNIAALLAFRRRSAGAESKTEHLSSAIVRFLGSFWSLLVHATVYGGWCLANGLLLPRAWRFDPPPFVCLAVVASVEAIVLTTFVLISQNRMARIEQRQSDLDVQIDLLAEHEITKLIELTEAIAKRLDVPIPDNLQDLERDVRPETVLAEIERADELAPAEPERRATRPTSAAARRRPSGTPAR
jgi:uncharacterized membrane protein